MEFPRHLAHYNRYLWNGPNLIVVTGEAEKLWQGRAAYNETYRIAAGAEGVEPTVNRLLAAVGLAAVSLAEREFWGWSVSLLGLSAGLFCGAEPEGMLCARELAQAKKASGLCVVQRQAEKTALAQSNFTMVTQDPVEAVERYFEEAEQTLIRIAVADNGSGVLLRPMPGGSFDVINGLGDSELIERVLGATASGDMKLLEEVLLFYGCPCSLDKIHAMIKNLPADQARQLWGDLDSLETACPRCGRVYEITRQEKGNPASQAGQKKSL